MVKCMLELEFANHKTFHLINPYRLDLKVMKLLSQLLAFEAWL